MAQKQILIMSIKSQKLVKFPGGRFLRVYLNKNTKGDYAWHHAAPDSTGRVVGGPATWDVSNPKTKIIALVGVGKKLRQNVFMINGKLYTRAYRHVVQGKKTTEYTEYYQRHPSPWGHGSAPRGQLRMALKPFKGEYTAFSRDAFTN